MKSTTDSPKKPGDIGYGPDGGLILYGYMPEGYISASEEPIPPEHLGDVFGPYGFYDDPYDLYGPDYIDDPDYLDDPYGLGDPQPGVGGVSEGFGENRPGRQA